MTQKRLSIKPSQELHFVNNSVPSDWECRLFGGGERGLVWHPVKDTEPNWFWRKMQYLIFGNEWIFKPTEKKS